MFTEAGIFDNLQSEIRRQSFSHNPPSLIYITAVAREYIEFSSLREFQRYIIIDYFYSENVEKSWYCLLILLLISSIAIAFVIVPRSIRDLRFFHPALLRHIVNL